ncbi:MAG: efflux RND transporter periplasmic adaptor subunit [Campylobacterales bacterium]
MKHFLLLVLAAASLLGETIAFSDKAVENLNVHHEKAQVREGIPMGPYPARVIAPPRQIRLSASLVDGLVDEVMVSLGASVEPSQVLATMISPTLLEWESGFVELFTQEAEAQKSYERLSQLGREGLASEQEVLQAKTRFDTLRLQRQSQEGRLRLTGVGEAELAGLKEGKAPSAKLIIRAPLSGRVVEVLVGQGQRIEAATPLFKVASLESVWLEISVPREATYMLYPGLEAWVSDEGQRTRAKVVGVSASVEGASQLSLVHAEVEKAHHLALGQELNAFVAREGRLWWLPAAAVTKRAGQAYVFARIEGGYEPVLVQISGEQGGGYLLLGALEGKNFAVNGTAAIKGAWSGLGGGDE